MVFHVVLFVFSLSVASFAEESRADRDRKAFDLLSSPLLFPVPAGTPQVKYPADQEALLKAHLPQLLRPQLNREFENFRASVAKKFLDSYAIQLEAEPAVKAKVATLKREIEATETAMREVATKEFPWNQVGDKFKAILADKRAELEKTDVSPGERARKDAYQLEYTAGEALRLAVVVRDYFVARKIFTLEQPLTALVLEARRNSTELLTEDELKNFRETLTSAALGMLRYQADESAVKPAATRPLNRPRHAGVAPGTHK